MDTAPGPRRKSAFENVFAQSLIAWRFLGAYACQAGICVVCMMGVSILKALVGVLPLHALRGGVGLQSWRWWLLVLSMQAAMGPAVLAFVLALDTKDMLVGIGKYDAYIPSFVSSRLVKIAGDVSHRRIPIAMGSHPSAQYQPSDSRFRPTLVPGVKNSPLTPLPAGVKAVFDDVAHRLARAST